MPPDPNIYVGVAAIIERDRQLLMLRRGNVGASISEGHGKWSVPGGWLAVGETPGETAVREAREETGVEVEPRYYEGFVCHDNSHGDKIVTLFVNCRWFSGEPRVTEPEKCPEVTWVPFVYVRQLPLFTPLDVWWRRQP